MTVYEPRLIELTDVNDTTHPNFSQIIFNTNHVVRDVEAHPDSLLIFEIQTPVKKKELNVNASGDDGSNGYPLLNEDFGASADANY